MFVLAFAARCLANPCVRWALRVTLAACNTQIKRKLNVTCACVWPSLCHLLYQPPLQLQVLPKDKDKYAGERFENAPTPHHT